MATPSVIPIAPPRLRPMAEKRREAERERERELRYKRSIDRRARLLDRLEARAAAFDLALKALRQRKDAALARFEKMEQSVLAEMQRARARKLTGMERIFTAKPNAPRLLVEDQSKIPAGYMRQPPIPDKEPDKVAIKALLTRATSKEATDEDIAAAKVFAGAVKLVQTVSLLRK